MKVMLPQGMKLLYEGDRAELTTGLKAVTNNFQLHDAGHNILFHCKHTHTWSPSCRVASHHF